jgi:CDP-diacylglycerol--glycerol-3-phosphate 3-phosphatidyltransferase
VASVRSPIGFPQTRGGKRRYLPNALTLLRIFFVPLLVSAMVQETVSFHLGATFISNDLLALAIFLCAAVTDLLDGYLARRWGHVTTVGTLLDPIADKLLISAALIALVQVHAVPGYLVILVVGREFAVTGLRSIAASEGYTIKASDLGKTKMIAQVVAVSATLLGMRHPFLRPWALAAMWAVVVFALASAVEYFLKFWRHVDERVKQRRRRELLREEKRQRRLARQRGSETSGVGVIN